MSFMMLGTANAQEAQISGYVKNSAGQGLEGKIVQTYFHLSSNGAHYNWNDVTDAQGRFSATQFTTNIDDIITPEKYKIDAPYPNPFNPSTTITVPIETQGNYEMILINPLGEQIAKYDGELNRGIHTFKIIEPGAAGVYIYGFKGEKGIITSGKIVYLGGGKTSTNIITHTGEKNLPQLNKTTEEAVWVDSIIVRGDAIQTKTFQINANIPQLIYDAGDLIVDSAFVNIDGKIYNLFDWQQQNNGVEGATVKIGNRQTTTNSDGTYNIQAPTGFQQMIITHPNIWTRKTKIVAYNDATIEDINVMDKTRMPEDYLAFFDSISSRIGDPARPPPANKLTRWMKNIDPLYIVADDTILREKQMKDTTLYAIENIWKEVTKTPMYPQGFLKDIVIQTGTNPPADFSEYSQIHRLEDDLGGPFALTFCYTNYFDSTSQTYLFGETHASVTKYWRNMPAAWGKILSIALHEQARAFMGLTSAIFDIARPSIFNAGLGGEFPDEPTDHDKRWILFTYSRLPGNTTPDTDYYIYNADTQKWIDPLNGRTIEKK